MNETGAPPRGAPDEDFRDAITIGLVTETVAQPRLRLLLEVDPALLRQLGTILFTLLFIYFALMTMPFVYHSLDGRGIDSSWQFAINYLGNAGLHFGTDVIFTYGPLGFVSWPGNIHNNLAIANLIRGTVWLILLIHVVRICRKAPAGFLKASLLIAGLCMSRYVLLVFFDYFIVATVLVVALDLIEEPRQLLGYVCLATLCTLALFVKFTGYILCLASIGLYLAVGLNRLPRISAWRVYVVAAVAILGGPLAFLAYQPSLNALRSYIVGSLEISSGFTEAMSLPTSPQDAFYVVVLTGLFLLGLAYAVARKALVWSAAPILAVLYWVAFNFKHGFVRSDIHVILTYSFAMFLATYLICLLRSSRELIIKYLLVLPVVFLTALSGINSYVSVWNSDFWASTNNRQLGLDLLDWFKTASRIEDSKTKTDEYMELPATFNGLLRESTTVVFPWELTYARTGQFRLWPLYTLQAYAACSRYLDSMTAAKLKASSTQIDYVLFEWNATDGRHPLLDVPVTWSELLDGYEPLLNWSGKMVLDHRNARLQHSFASSSTSLPLPIGQWVNLPQTASVLWGKFDIPYSREGFLRKVLYKTDALYLSLERASGGVGRFRVLPGVLSSAFPLNIMPLDFSSLQNLWGSGLVYDPIVRVRLESDSPDDFARPKLELFQELASTIKVINENSVSFRSKFGIDSPDRISNVMLASMDLINKGPVVLFPDEAHPFLVRRNHGLELIGWGITADKKSVFDGLYGVINGRHWFRAVSGQRMDVANGFKDTALEFCGYKLTIPGAELLAGIQRVDLVGVVNKTHGLYHANPIYVEVR